MPYTSLAHSYWVVSMTHINAKTTAINNNGCSCHITDVELFNQSYGVHIKSLVTNNLRGGHTHTHTTHTHKTHTHNTHTHTHNTHTHNTHTHTHTHTNTHAQHTHIHTQHTHTQTHAQAEATTLQQEQIQ